MYGKKANVVIGSEMKMKMSVIFSAGENFCAMRSEVYGVLKLSYVAPRLIAKGGILVHCACIDKSLQGWKVILKSFSDQPSASKCQSSMILPNMLHQLQRSRVIFEYLSEFS